MNRSKLRAGSLRRLFLAGLLFAAALALALELARRNGVGTLEYIAGIAIVAILLFAAYRMSRRATGRVSRIGR